MSRRSETASKEEAINELYATIKNKFEQDGVLQEIRCLLQSKMVAMMKGDNDAKTLVQRPQGDNSGDARVMMLHQLFMEYLHWHGFHYTAEMFSLESACENVKPLRQCLEGVLGEFDHREVPILLQIVAELMQKQNKKQ